MFPAKVCACIKCGHRHIELNEVDEKVIIERMGLAVNNKLNELGMNLIHINVGPVIAKAAYAAIANPNDEDTRIANTAVAVKD
jgi:hypothetical protein